MKLSRSAAARRRMAECGPLVEEVGEVGQRSTTQRRRGFVEGAVLRGVADELDHRYVKRHSN